MSGFISANPDDDFISDREYEWRKYARGMKAIRARQAATITSLQAEVAALRPLPITDREIALRLAVACDAAGGQKEMAKKLGVAVSFVNAVIHGNKPPSDRILKELGLERVTFYRAALGGADAR